MSARDSSCVVRVAVPRPLPQLFDYLAPPGGPAPVVGARMRVPFGRQTLTGICVAVDPPHPHPDPKPVREVLDGENVFGTELYHLSLWLADYYHHPLGETLATVLPAAARKGADMVVRRQPVWRLTDARPDLSRAPKQQALLEHLQAAGGGARPEALQAAGFTAAVIRALEAKGVLVREREGAPTTASGPKTSVYVSGNPGKNILT